MLEDNLLLDDATAPDNRTRLEALASYGILDTMPEQGFDDIVLLAARVCDTPVALISLVSDDRQWFKARVGFEPCQTPLDQSVCAHALGRTDLLVIPDLALDERTKDNTLVTRDPYIRFYAGAPLTTPSGATLGTLCVIDLLPRPEGLSGPRAEGLRALARQVMAQLESRRAVAEREDLVAELRQAQHEVSTERQRLSDMFEQAPSFIAVLRGQDHVFEMANPAYMRLVGHREIVGRSVADALPDAAAQGYVDLLDRVYRTGEPFSTNGALYAVQSVPGGPVNQRYVDFVYQPMRDADGRTTGIFVEGVDVTDRITSAQRLRDSQDRFRALAENVDVGMCIIELKFDGKGQAVDYRILEGNDAYERHTGLHGSVGKWVSEIAPGLEQRWFDLYGSVATTGEPVRFEQGAETLGGRWFEVQAHRVGLPEAGHVAILFTEVTERKRTEEQRTELAHEMAHRMKNVLAMVQSIATQTFRTAGSVEEARDAVSGRIAALARAQGILTTTQWEAAPIADVVATALAPHRSVDGERFVVGGPKVELTSQQGLGLSLALHELATNAAKYGALSNADGKIWIDWTCTTDGAFGFEWRETDGPMVVGRTRTGFGSRLIERLVAAYFEGRTELLFEPTGVRFVLTGTVLAPPGNDGRYNASADAGIQY